MIFNFKILWSKKFFLKTKSDQSIKLLLLLKELLISFRYGWNDVNCFPNKKIVFPKIQSIAKLLNLNIDSRIVFAGQKQENSW